VSPLGSCWLFRELHPQGGSKFVHQWREGPRSETALPHRQRKVPQWSP
jgi:hypothetical protein